MTNLMQTLIAQADAKHKENPQNIYGGAVAQSEVGEVRLYRDYKVGNSFSRNRSHARSNWRLNGNVISATKLANLLK
jgi:hypothetical protein